MRIITNTLESIAQIQWFPIIGLLIFFLFFSILLIRVFRMKKSEVEAISRLPLEDDDEVDNSNIFRN